MPNQDGEFTDVLITCESIKDGVFVQSAEFYTGAYGQPIFDALYHYERVLAWSGYSQKWRNSMSMTVREEAAIVRLHDFMEEHGIECAEDVYQRDSVNEECVDFVAELVELMLEG